NEDKNQAPLAQILPDVDLEEDTKAFYVKYPESNLLDYLSYKMFPKVYDEYYTNKNTYGEVNELPTPAFYYPLKKDKEISVRLNQGKLIFIKLIFVSAADEEGIRTVTFQLNGGNRTVNVKDNSVTSTKQAHQKVANPSKEVGAPLQGSLSSVMV